MLSVVAPVSSVVGSDGKGPTTNRMVKKCIAVFGYISSCSTTPLPVRNAGRLDRAVPFVGKPSEVPGHSVGDLDTKTEVERNLGLRKINKTIKGRKPRKEV